MKRSKTTSKSFLTLIAVAIIGLALGCGAGYIVGVKSIHRKPQASQSAIINENFSASSMDKANWNTYTNVTGDFSIQYPSTWKIEESHQLSNRKVDDVTEINTATLRGKEGEIIFEWGPMGFGGGCEEKYSNTLKLKELDIIYCRGTADGKSYLSQIYNPNHKYPFGARALYYSDKDEAVIEAIFSTLTFLK